MPEDSKVKYKSVELDFSGSFRNIFSENLDFTKDIFSEKQIDNDEEPLQPLVLSDGEILAKDFVFFLIALAAGGVLSFIVRSLIIDSLLLSFSIHLVGTYLILVFFSYFLSKLFRREGSGEVWSLKKSFLFVGLIYFSLVALVITIIALTL